MRFSDFYDRHVIVRYAAVGAAVIVILSLGLDFMDWGVHRLRTLRPMTHLSAPAPAPKPKPAKKTTPAPTSTTAKPKPLPAPTSLADALLPGQTPPAHLKAGQFLRQLWTAPTPAKLGIQPNWVPIASVWGQAPTSAFSTLVPKSMQALVPTRGLLKTQFSAWIKVPKSGQESLILSLSQGGGKVTLVVDGQPAPLLRLRRACNPFSGCPTTPTVAAARIGLAHGWHRIAVTVSAPIHLPPMIVTIYGRGVGSSAPTEFIPYAHGSARQ